MSRKKMRNSLTIWMKIHGSPGKRHSGKKAQQEKGSREKGTVGNGHIEKKAQSKNKSKFKTQELFYYFFEDLVRDKIILLVDK